MKLKSLSLAVCAAVGTMAATSAMAVGLLPSAYTAANTSDYYVSGASAQDNGLLGLARRVCAVGTLTQFTISNDNVYFCQANPAQISGTKTNIAIHKYSVGGSGNGIGPVAFPTVAANKLPFLDLTKLASGFATNCTASSSFSAIAGIAPDTVGLPAYTAYNCAAVASSTLTTSLSSVVGFADVEPALFETLYPGATAILAPNQKSTVSVIMGVPVTLKLRNAMQSSQFATTSVCNPANAAYATNVTINGITAANGETEACMPSLSAAALTSVYTGNATTWAQLGITTGFSDDGVYVARRVDSSGTQKAFAIHATLEACNANATDLFGTGSGTTVGDAESDCSIPTASGPNPFYLGSGGGNVRNCLLRHDSMTGVNTRGAIGVLTTEDKAATTTTASAGIAVGSGWRFIAINGYAPTEKNVANGNYKYYAESTYQYKNLNPGVSVTKDDHTPLVNAINTNLVLPNVVQAINTGYQQTFGYGGLLALASAQPSFTPAFPYTDAAIVDTPINPWSKLVSGSLSNCQPAKLFN